MLISYKNPKIETKSETVISKSERKKQFENRSIKIVLFRYEAQNIEFVYKIILIRYVTKNNEIIIYKQLNYNFFTI